MTLNATLRAAVLAAMCCLVSVGNLMADAPRNTITLDNQSGTFVLVKIVGATPHIVEVPDHQQRTVPAAAGEYYLLARYGSDPGGYSYLRGDPFLVEEGADRYTETTITLQRVADGNYTTQPTTCEEFAEALSAQDGMDDLPKPALNGATSEAR